MEGKAEYWYYLYRLIDVNKCREERKELAQLQGRRRGAFGVNGHVGLKVANVRPRKKGKDRIC